jgi:hypothetical protein
VSQFKADFTFLFDTGGRRNSKRRSTSQLTSTSSTKQRPSEDRSSPQTRFFEEGNRSQTRTVEDISENQTEAMSEDRRRDYVQMLFEDRTRNKGFWRSGL